MMMECCELDKRHSVNGRIRVTMKRKIQTRRWTFYLAFLISTLFIHSSQSFLSPNKFALGAIRIDSSSSLLAKSGKKKKKPKDGTVCVNRQARRNYEIVETLEAGVALKGTEVKR